MTRRVPWPPGKGEFGEVLLAKARAEGSEEESVVLVKSLQSREEQLQLDFRREADMFAKLSHANVARLLGVCREAEPHYTVMEYCDLVRPGGAHTHTHTQRHTHSLVYTHTYIHTHTLTHTFSGAPMQNSCTYLNSSDKH